jgi:hypothetical protein
MGQGTLGNGARIGSLTTKRADGTPFSYHSCDLTYTVEPFGSLHISLWPFRQNIDAQYISTIADLMRSHVNKLSPVLALYHVVHKGEPHQLPERIDTLRRRYIEAVKRDEAELDDAPAPLAAPEPDLPAFDSYAITRPGVWWAVLARDNWTCCSCGRSTRQDGVLLEVDHILPRSRGGTDALDNLQTLCKKCHIGKSNRDATDLGRA